MKDDCFICAKFRQDFSKNDCYLIFDKIVNLDNEEGIGRKGNDINAKSWEKHIAVKIGCLKILDSFFLEWRLRWIIHNNIPTIHANGMDNELS